MPPGRRVSGANATVGWVSRRIDQACVARWHGNGVATSGSTNLVLHGIGLSAPADLLALAVVGSLGRLPSSEAAQRHDLSIDADLSLEPFPRLSGIPGVIGDASRIECLRRH